MQEWDGMGGPRATQLAATRRCEVLPKAGQKGRWFVAKGNEHPAEKKRTKEPLDVSARTASTTGKGGSRMRRATAGLLETAGRGGKAGWWESKSKSKSKFGESRSSVEDREVEEREKKKRKSESEVWDEDEEEKKTRAFFCPCAVTGVTVQEVGRLRRHARSGQQTRRPEAGSCALGRLDSP
ncbi:hypothetical protein MGYG_09046 [Nannizzia gypsea CBS 118893]|uniref:Uncharacterized protein n=1 Tax=Arthroderma gypseum (strain ATCC MYA-4604 / CBS 118893) TaxID=535722 RepID=E4USW3_ARTGP|nr:hypothetical protein MGYG_09046 [Nannizzia gypsea CBS 118893]EFR01412.1 hypothetical protein MGYG_09046 [Nannizzia gypsea CBS 118893]